MHAQPLRRVVKLRKLLKQRLGLLQIGGVKALGEPAVDRCEQFSRFVSVCPAVATAEPGSWRPAAQATWPPDGGPRPGLDESRFLLPLAAASSAAERGTPEATDFRFPPAFLVLLYQCVGLGQHLEAIFRVAQMVTDVPAGCKSIGHTALPHWPERQRSPGGPGPSPPHPAWPAPTRARSLPRAAHCGKPCAVESATAASACPCTASTSRRYCETKAAQHRANARLYGCDSSCANDRASWRRPELVPGTPATRGSARQRLGRQHPDLMAHAERRSTVLVWRVACDGFL